MIRVGHIDRHKMLDTSLEHLRYHNGGRDKGTSAPQFNGGFQKALGQEIEERLGIPTERQEQP